MFNVISFVNSNLFLRLSQQEEEFGIFNWVDKS